MMLLLLLLLVAFLLPLTFLQPTQAHQLEHVEADLSTIEDILRLLASGNDDELYVKNLYKAWMNEDYVNEHLTDAASQLVFALYADVEEIRVAAPFAKSLAEEEEEKEKRKMEERGADTTTMRLHYASYKRGLTVNELKLKYFVIVELAEVILVMKHFYTMLASAEDHLYAPPDLHSSLRVNLLHEFTNHPHFAKKYPTLAELLPLGKLAAGHGTSTTETPFQKKWKELLAHYLSFTHVEGRENSAVQHDAPFRYKLFNMAPESVSDIVTHLKMVWVQYGIVTLGILENLVSLLHSYAPEHWGIDILSKLDATDAVKPMLETMILEDIDQLDLAASYRELVVEEDAQQIKRVGDLKERAKAVQAIKPYTREAAENFEVLARDYGCRVYAQVKRYAEKFLDELRPLLRVDSQRYIENFSIHLKEQHVFLSQLLGIIPVKEDSFAKVQWKEEWDKSKKLTAESAGNEGEGEGEGVWMDLPFKYRLVIVEGEPIFVWIEEKGGAMEKWAESITPA